MARSDTGTQPTKNCAGSAVTFTDAHEPASPRVGVQSLTQREREVVRLVVDRNTNPQIAEALFLSPKTVETHMRNIFRKLGVSSRVTYRLANHRVEVVHPPTGRLARALGVKTATARLAWARNATSGQRQQPASFRALHPPAKSTYLNKQTGAILHTHIVEPIEQSPDTARSVMAQTAFGSILAQLAQGGASAGGEPTDDDQ